MIYKFISRKFVLQNQKALPYIHTSIHNQLQWGKNIEKNKVAEIKKYWFYKYIDYFKNCVSVKRLEKKFPKTMRLYLMFSNGTKDFFKDVIKFVVVLKKQATFDTGSLTIEQLRLYHTVPKDLVKIFPISFISIIPFTCFVVLPLVYFLPRHLLTHHYWTLQQKLDFMLLDHKKRLKHSRPLFRCMQAELHNIKDQTLKMKWNGIIACLDSGTHPNVNDIIACSELFAGEPYSLNNLKREHVKELLGIYDIPSWTLYKKLKLTERGMLIKQMDQVIQKEGGSIKLPNDEISWAVSFRGVNPANMSIESMRNWLDQWFVISNIVDENTISLLLHSPILLAYNHPTNCILIYK